MRRLLLPLAALVALACLLGACNASIASVAASVGGTAISQGSFSKDLTAVGNDSAFTCVLTGGGSEPTKGAGEGTFDSSFAAQVLTTLVEGKALNAALAREHLAAASLARQLGQQELELAFAPGQSQDQACTASAAKVLAGLPGRVRGALLDVQTAQAVLAAHEVGVELTPAGVQSWASAHPKAATLTCLDLAAFSSQSSAASVASAVRSGTSFASAATAAGGQPESGCVPAGTLPGNLGTVVSGLAVGSVSKPVSYQSEWLTFEVTSRKAATGVQAAELLLDSLASRAKAVLDGALRTAQVSVDPTYGRWGEVSGSYEVIPPTGPSSGALLNPSAVSATASSALG